MKTLKFLAVLMLTMFTLPAFSQLPWEENLQVVGDGLTAAGFWIGVIGFIVAGAIMAFGNDMSDIGRRIVVATMGVSVVLMAQDFIGAIFG